jgi:uncharacterized coiled-coil protein SlyX
VLKLIKIAANRLAKLEAQLAFANATVSALRGQLESTTAERDAAQERNVVLQSEHMDHVSALHKRIKELEKKNDHK